MAGPRWGPQGEVSGSAAAKVNRLPKVIQWPKPPPSRQGPWGEAGRRRQRGQGTPWDVTERLLGSVVQASTRTEGRQVGKPQTLSN